MLITNLDLFIENLENFDIEEKEEMLIEWLKSDNNLVSELKKVLIDITHLVEE